MWPDNTNGGRLPHSFPSSAACGGWGLSLAEPQVALSNDSRELKIFSGCTSCFFDLDLNGNTSQTKYFM